MTGYEPQGPQGIGQDAGQATRGTGDPMSELIGAEADGHSPRPAGVQQMKERMAGQAGQATQVAKEKTAQMQEKAAEMQEKASGLASRARDVAGSEQAKPMAKRMGGALIIAGSIAAIVVWRRRVNRNMTPMQRLARTARTQADITRGQARAARKMAKAAGARATAKATKSAKDKMRSKARR